MSEPNPSATPGAYELRVVLRGISPLMWRRLLVRGDTTIADLHRTLQIAFAGETSLQRFVVHRREQGAKFSSTRATCAGRISDSVSMSTSSVSTTSSPDMPAAQADWRRRSSSGVLVAASTPATIVHLPPMCAVTSRKSSERNVGDKTPTTRGRGRSTKFGIGVSTASGRLVHDQQCPLRGISIERTFYSRHVSIDQVRPRAMKAPMVTGRMRRLSHAGELNAERPVGDNTHGPPARKERLSAID